jgi:DNA-binding HxlR family transcriptional regulator
MPLPKDYAQQQCSLSRALEVVGERWTLLIVRDAFFGVRRFSDFAAHLKMPRAVLSERLGSLTEAGVLTRVSGAHGHTEYALTSKGMGLWPIVRSLLAWGDEHYTDSGPLREFRHGADDGLVRSDGTCERCAGQVPVTDLVIAPGPGAARLTGDDIVSRTLASRRPMLEPIRPGQAAGTAASPA